MVVVFILSGINLPIFNPLNPAIYRIGNIKKILFPSSKEQDESQPSPHPAPTHPTPAYFTFYCRFEKLHQTNLTTQS